MKTCSTSFVIREMHIKITVGYNFPHTRMAIIRKMGITSIGEDVETLEHLCNAGGNENGVATVKKRLAVSQKVKHGVT